MTIQEAYDEVAGHFRAGRWQQADFLLQQVLARQPAHADALHLMGLLWHQYGRSPQAIGFVRRAIDLNSNSADYYNSLATMLAAQGAADGAMSAARQALALRPDFPEAHHNLAMALAEKGQLDEAIAGFRQALALKPNSSQAAFRLANLLKKVGQLDEALACYAKAAAATSDPCIASSLLYALHFHPGCDPARIAEEHARWNRAFARPLAARIRPHNNPGAAGPTERRLKIGYVSPNFRQHPIGRFLAPLLANHDREKFEVYCYSDVQKPDEMTRRFDSFDLLWRDVVGLSNEELAERVRGDGIDILVDLTQHMEGSRLLAFALKPAPIQVTYLGCCGTSGLETMDYRLTDTYLDPPTSGAREGEAPAEPVFRPDPPSLVVPLTPDESRVGKNEPGQRERLVRLNCYWCYEAPAEAPPVGPLPARRAGHVTFGCLNDYSQITPPTWAAWRELLAASEGSKLIVHAPQGGHREAVRSQFAADGIDPQRVQFVDRLPFDRYLEQHNYIDIALDPFPFCGGITSCDALWMGVPVVSLIGQTAVSRAGLSILSHVGLGELVARTSGQHIQIAAGLASNVARLEQLRSSLRDRVLASPIMDARRFARELEAAYSAVWKAWCNAARRRTM